MLPNANAAVDAVYHSDWGRIVATLIGHFGDFEVAEDAAQEAFVAAVNQWRIDGVPEFPRAWIVQTAKHKAIDRLRRRTRIKEKLESYAESGLISTVGDLEKFDLSLKSGWVMPPEWRTFAWTPPTDSAGTPLPHAYGWFVQNYNGGRLVWQFGVSDNASSSMILMVPQRGLTFIVAANSSGLVRPFNLAAGDVTISPFAKLFLSVFVR